MCVLGKWYYLMKAPRTESKSPILLKVLLPPTPHPASIKGNPQPWLSLTVVMEIVRRMGPGAPEVRVHVIALALSTHVPDAGVRTHQTKW